jgi:hypothetical protein
VQHEYDVVAQVKRVPQREQVVALLGVAVAVRAGRAELVRATHPDHVGRDQPSQPLQVWHHVAPQVGRRRVAVREDDGVSLALVDVGHLAAFDIAVLQFPVRVRSGHVSPSVQAPQSHTSRDMYADRHS